MTSTPPGDRQHNDPARTVQLRLPPQPRAGRPGRQPKAPPRYDYEHHSRLAGPLTQPEAGRPYTVRYRSLLSQEPHRIRAALLLGAAPLVSLGLFVWLMQPGHWTERDPNLDNGTLPALDIVMLVAIGLIELFRTMNVLSNAHATLVARDPVPVVPESGTRVAFLTSFVPGKEPLEMVTRTLEAAVRIRHRGLMHVWLLDEGDDPAVKEVCARLGVHHFSRKGVARWNMPKGPHRARTKHGNYNAWLDAHGDAYDYFASVDTDHVPLPNYLERMLGYFRDPDVGFVIGPQVYGNYDTFVTKAAESQQFLFHALIQRAGNKYGAPMFVGTSNAVRIKALKQIGGLYDSITEDMATGFEIHRAKNPATGRKWRSVYTPDVLAVGEGPSAWTDFFTQQMRWSRGTYETILKQYWKGWYSLPPSKLFNYTMMIIFYPMSALNWILAALSCALFLGLGASGVNIDPTVWLMLYGNAYGSPMFVGTSNAVRIRALKQIGGLYDSITEDMATGFEMHRHRNPATGRKWRSVYTPDVLAVGEGPNAWTDFFTQQMRWSRGTYETIIGQYWKGFYSLPPSKLFNYTMMIIFYPMSALNWILAAISCALFLGLGASGVNIDPTIWLMLYGNASALQIGLYVWNRRHNVSPHEPEGSGGVAGMVMSALSAPLYAKALIDSVLRKKSKFVVTPKGDSASPDRWFGTFRYHWYFIAIFGASITAGFVYGHSHPAMITWATFAMLITATPIFAWRYMLRQEKKKPAATVPAQTGPQDAVATGATAAPYQPQPMPAHATPPHTPHGQQKPSWAASGSGGNDQTMQIALGGLGGRKE